MRGYLPVEEIVDTLKRLNYVNKNSMDGLKKSNQAVAADALTAVQNFAPPTILAQASRLNFSTRLFNLLVTNVPGPQLPLFLLDRPMVDVFPIPFLAENHTLSVAVMSYNGRLNFGILADYDAVPGHRPDRPRHRRRAGHAGRAGPGARSRSEQRARLGPPGAAGGPEAGPRRANGTMWRTCD